MDQGEGENRFFRDRDAILVIACLIATVSLTVAIAPPGGIGADGMAVAWTTSFTSHVLNMCGNTLGIQMSTGLVWVMTDNFERGYVIRALMLLMNVVYAIIWFTTTPEKYVWWTIGCIAMINCVVVSTWAISRVCFGWAVVWRYLANMYGGENGNVPRNDGVQRALLGDKSEHGNVDNDKTNEQQD